MPTSAQDRIQEAALRLFAEKGSTQITVSALAQEAGIARGTVSNNIEKPHQLFESVATRLVDEMHARIVSTFNPALDPAIRLANGIRLFIRRTHEEPTWARFISRFAHSEESLKKLFAGSCRQFLDHGDDAGQHHAVDSQAATFDFLPAEGS